VDTLEAQLETRKAYLRAAEAAVKVPKLKFEQVTRLSKGANPVVSHTEADLAKAELEAAEAQVPIRQAEVKEVEVRLKHAKKRLEDAKNPPARPANPNRRGERPADRKPVDPQK
jgi:multidrug resistance efflux pump